MKKPALLLAGILMASVAVLPLAACKNDFNVGSYAKPLSEYSSILSEGYSFTKVGTIDARMMSLSSSRLLKAQGTGDNASKFQLIDSRTDLPALGEWYDSINYVGSSAWKLGNDYLAFQLVQNDGVTINRFCGPDGTLLTNDSVYVAPNASAIGLFSTETHTLKGERDSVIVYVFSYYATDLQGYVVGGEITKYFTYLEGADGQRVWKEISAADLDPESGENNGDYSVGREPSGSKTPLSALFGINEADYPTRPYSDYSVSYEGTSAASRTYTFWNKNEKTGSVTIENGSYVGIAGDYLFFYELTPVSADAARGYNLQYSLGGAIPEKAQYTLYRYNFVKNKKPKKVNTKYVILGNADDVLYNYDSGSFDRWITDSAYKIKDGVAVINSFSKRYKLLLGENGTVSMDLSNKNDVGTDFYRLTDNRYLAGNTIVDGALETVARLQSVPRLWKSAELLQVSTSEGYAFVDFTGKVAIPPIASNTFYYFDNVLVAGVNGDYSVFSARYPKGRPVDDIVGCESDAETVIPLFASGYNLLVKRTAVTDEDGLTYSYKFYNLDGYQIGTPVSGYTSSTCNINFTVGKKLYISMQRESGASTVVLW